jgi:uncharacterized protein YbaR (Trm112 family)
LDFRFCPADGHELLLRQEDDESRTRYVCPTCKRVWVLTPSKKGMPEFAYVDDQQYPAGFERRTKKR